MVVRCPVCPRLSLPPGNVIYFSGMTSFLVNERIGKVYGIFDSCFLYPGEICQVQGLAETMTGIVPCFWECSLWKTQTFHGKSHNDLMRVLTGNWRLLWRACILVLSIWALPQSLGEQHTAGIVPFGPPDDLSFSQPLFLGAGMGRRNALTSPRLLPPPLPFSKFKAPWSSPQTAMLPLKAALYPTSQLTLGTGLLKESWRLMAQCG